MATVPNHAQIAQIARDLKAFSKGELPDSWMGNSYWGRSAVREGTRLYVLGHWNTEIAAFFIDNAGTVRVAGFRASYISSTTRGFQGRILRAMSGIVSTSDQGVIDTELGKPTQSRGSLGHDISLGHLSLIG